MREDLAGGYTFDPSVGQVNKKAVTSNPSFSEVATGEEIVYSYFDAAGRRVNDNARAFAKTATTGNSKTYYVRRSTFGPDRGELADSRGLYFDAAKLDQANARMGSERYEFFRVPASCFASYMEYLQHGKKSDYRQANASKNDPI